jgi:hypothetical protein
MSEGYDPGLFAEPLEHNPALLQANELNEAPVLREKDRKKWLRRVMDALYMSGPDEEKSPPAGWVQGVARDALNTVDPLHKEMEIKVCTV